MGIERHFAVLGHKVRDRVTGLSGIATSVSFDLYGCVQVLVNTGADKDGKLQDQYWMDIARVEVFSDRVMEPPDFLADVPEPITGPAEKPRATGI